MRSVDLNLDVDTEILLKSLMLQLRRHNGVKYPVNSPKDLADLLKVSGDIKNYKIQNAVKKIKSNLADGTLASYLSKHGVNMGDSRIEENQTASNELGIKVDDPLATDAINQKVQEIFKRNNHLRHVSKASVRH